MAVQRLAISSTPGELCLSLREDFQRGAETGNAAVVIDSSDADFETVSIRADTLDNQAAEFGWDRLDVLKIDIEGHEDPGFDGRQEDVGEVPSGDLRRVERLVLRPTRGRSR